MLNNHFLMTLYSTFSQLTLVNRLQMLLKLELTLPFNKLYSPFSDFFSCSNRFVSN